MNLKNIAALLKEAVVVIELVYSIQSLPGVVQYQFILGKLEGVFEDHITISEPSRLYEINNIQQGTTTSNIIPYSISFHVTDSLPITFSQIVSIFQAGDHTAGNYQKHNEAVRASKAGLTLATELPKGRRQH
jgi:hypothetical protein